MNKLLSAIIILFAMLSPISVSVAQANEVKSSETETSELQSANFQDLLDSMKTGAVIGKTILAFIGAIVGLVMIYPYGLVPAIILSALGTVAGGALGTFIGALISGAITYYSQLCCL